MNNYIEENRGVITNSKLQDFLICPSGYNLKFNLGKVKPVEKDAFVYGQALDDALISPSVFNKKYEVVSTRVNVEEKQGKVKDKIQKLKEREKLTPKMQETLSDLKNEENYLKRLKDRTQLTPTMFAQIEATKKELERQHLFDFSEEAGQVKLEVDYKGYKIRGKLDNYRPELNLIVDLKSCASLPIKRQYLEKYLDQLCLYHFLAELKDDFRGDGVLVFCTKEEIPRVRFYKIPSTALIERRGYLFQNIDRLIDCEEAGIFPLAEQEEKILECPAYGICDCGIQEDFILI